MKKPDISPLIVLTLLFAVCLTGLFYVRNYRGTEVQCSIIPANTADLPTASHDTPLININTATSSDLMTLPGIGEVLAGRIISYRNVHGKFQTAAELLNVEGIGSGKLEAILDYITTGGK